MSQYVGAVNTHHDAFADTIYTPIGANPMSFSITSDDDGKFKSLSHAPGLTIFQQNLIKGWAAQLQINAGEISRGNKAFISTEVRLALKNYRFKYWKHSASFMHSFQKTLHGDCDIQYTVTNDAVYKTVAHMKDCKNRHDKTLESPSSNLEILSPLEASNLFKIVPYNSEVLA